MVTLNNSFEGLSDGTLITAANSGGSSGDPFSSDGVGSVVAEADAAVVGSMGCRASLVASTQAYRPWAVSGSTHFIRIYFTTLPGATTHNARMVWNGVAASATAGWDIRQIVSTERVGLATRNSTRFELGPGGGGTGILARATKYRAEAKFVVGTPGSIEARLYSLGGTLLDSNTFAGTVDPVTVGELRYGLGNGANVTSQMDYDGFGYSDTDWLGALVSNLPPIADAGVDQTVEPWSTVVLSGADSDPDGTIVSRLWTQTGGDAVTLTGATTATPSFTAPPGVVDQALTFEYAVTDDDGATDTDTTTVTVLAAPERAIIGGIEVPMRVIAL